MCFSISAPQLQREDPASPCAGTCCLEVHTEALSSLPAPHGPAGTALLHTSRQSWPSSKAIEMIIPRLAYTSDALLPAQNHRITEVGRDLWRSPSPTPCWSRSLQQVAQESVQARSEYLQRSRLHDCSGQLFSALSPSQETSSCSHRIPVFQSVPLVLISAHQRTEPGPTHLIPTL